MILEYKFGYLSTSLSLERLLLKELKISGLNGSLYRKDDNVLLYVEADEKELEEFSDVLSKFIPHSLFLKGVEVNAVDKMPLLDNKLPNFPRRQMPFCPRCQQEALKSYNPFKKCEGCGYDVKESVLTLKNFAKVIRGDNKTIFQELAKVIKNGGKVKIKTFNGYKKISLPNEKNFKSLKGDFEILCADLQGADELFALTKSQTLALGSFEKPILELATDAKAIKRYPFFSQLGFVRVRLSDDLILELLMHSLKDAGVSEVLLEDSNDTEQLNVELDFESEIRPLKALEVMTLSNGEIILKKGERSLLPKADWIEAKTVIKAFSDNFVAINYENEIVVYKKEKELPECKNTFTLDGSASGYEAAHGAFYSIVNEHRLYEQTSCGIYLSKVHSDRVMVYSKRFGLVDYLQFDMNFPSTKEELFEMLSQGDENSKKLVNNYRAKFPLLCKDDMIFDQKMGDIYKLWGVASLLLGYEKSGNVKKAAKTLTGYAYRFKGKKGPRIDYKLRQRENKPKLDGLKMLKTAMSFRLAGIDEMTLSFGVVESFAEFVSNIVDEISRDYDIDKVCFSGSLFELSNFLDKFYTITNKNYETITNKEFILDDMALGYGIINGIQKEIQV